MSKTFRGLIHVYTGDGKGKTSAALGLALRAAGHGRRTFIAQFMKGQEYGELLSADMLGVDTAGRPLLEIKQFGKPSFVRAGQATEAIVGIGGEKNRAGPSGPAREDW